MEVGIETYPPLTKAYTVAVEQSVNKVLKQVDFNIRLNGNGIGSGEGSYVKSNMTCHKCGKKVHKQKDFRSKVNGSGGNPHKKSANILPELVSKKIFFQIPNILQQTP